MDPQERKVLRWKRDLLSANLTWDEPTIRKLKSYDLIWDSIINEIEETEMKNCEKIWKYLEHLMRAKLDKNVFNVLCDFLDEENPWISSELRVELSLERGQLKIDDYIKHEASILIHRHLGTTKRLSEGEKRQLEELLAVRTQCTKNIWIKNVEQTKQALNEQIAMAKNRDAVLKGMIRKIQSFLNQNWSMSSRNSRDSADSEEGNLDLITYRHLEDESGKGLTRKIEISVDKLLEFASSCTEKLEILKEEKLRSYEVLDHSAVQHKDEDKYSRAGSQTRLDKDIIKFVRAYTEKLNDSVRNTEESERKLREATKQMHDMKLNYDQELQERDRNIRFLAGTLEKCQLESQEKAEETIEFKDKLGVALARVAELENQLKYWERYRYYGYWYNRHDERNLSKSMRELNVNIDKKSPISTAITIPKGKKLLSSRGVITKNGKPDLSGKTTDRKTTPPSGSQ